MKVTAEITPEQELLDGLSVMPAHPAAMMDSVSFGDISSGSFLVHKTLGICEDIVHKYMPNARFRLYLNLRLFPYVLCQTEYRPALRPACIHRCMGDNSCDFLFRYTVIFCVL